MGTDRQPAGLALGNVPENPIRPFGELGPEVVIGGWVAGHQTIDDAWRVNFLGFVGWAFVRERFTVGHGSDWTMVAFSLAPCPSRRLAVGDSVRKLLNLEPALAVAEIGQLDYDFDWASAVASRAPRRVIG